MAPDPSPLDQLQAWYLANRDGDWEHSIGVRVDTLDNPGWSVQIDLTRTADADRAFERVEIERSEHDWLSCWRDSSQFHAACGPLNLSEALGLFLAWMH